MRKESQRKNIIERKQSSNKKNIKADCESIASGAMQHKVWKPGEQQQTTSTTKGKL